MKITSLHLMYFDAVAIDLVSDSLERNLYYTVIFEQIVEPIVEVKLLKHCPTLPFVGEAGFPGEVQLHSDFHLISVTQTGISQ